MRIASWNVNSLRVRLPQVLDWLNTASIDVLGLQETKLVDEQFPTDAFKEIGYNTAYSGQKTYNGVALITRDEPSDVVTDLPGLDDPQRRVLAATVSGTRILNLYVPNGQSVGSDKYEYKLAWLRALNDFVEDELAGHDRLVVMGDFNIAPEDRDVHDPVEWEGSVLVSEAERTQLQALFTLGLVDTFRAFDQKEAIFSWWDYRAAGFRRNRGLRIDLILASRSLADICTSSVVDKEPRTSERPSDHAPVLASFD